MRQVAFVLTTILALLLAACGGGSGKVEPGNPERGKQLYTRSTLGKRSAEGCVTCHKYDESEGKAEKAPYTKGTATRAATRVPGLSAEEYIRESILKPNAYIVEGWNKDDMYQKWAEDLTPQEIEDLVVYLLTEK